MANPQCENGYTKIANEIMDNFCSFRIPGEVRLVIDTVIRKTYGYNKTEDKISNSQFIKITGMRHGNVSRAVSKAIRNRLILKNNNKYKFNKNYKEWIEFGSKFRIKSDTVSKVIQPRIKSDTKSVSKVRNTKDNKDNIQKKSQNKLKNFEELDFKTLYALEEFSTKDIAGEHAKALDWLRSTGKQYKDYTAFFRNWLRKSPDVKLKKASFKKY